MKIKDYKCRCGHDDFYLFTPENCIGENHVGIYCSYCGKWFKWADKGEKNLAMNCVTKIRNDLIKNGDDLIKRQDAIDALDKDPMGGLNYNRILNNLPSAQKTGKWTHKSEYDLYPYDILTCSACGETDARMYRSDEYCPHCGARMVGEKE